MKTSHQIYRILMILFTALVLWNIVLVLEAIYSQYSRFNKEAWLVYAGIWIVGLVGRWIFSLGSSSYGKKNIGTLILGFMGILATLLISLELTDFG